PRARAVRPTGRRARRRVQRQHARGSRQLLHHAPVRQRCRGPRLPRIRVPRTALPLRRARERTSGRVGRVRPPGIEPVLQVHRGHEPPALALGLQPQEHDRQPRRNPARHAGADARDPAPLLHAQQCGADRRRRRPPRPRVRARPTDVRQHSSRSRPVHQISHPRRAGPPARPSRDRRGTREHRVRAGAVVGSERQEGSAVDIRRRRVLRRDEPGRITVPAPARGQRPVALGGGELLHARPHGPDHDQRRDHRGQTAPRPRRAQRRDRQVRHARLLQRVRRRTPEAAACRRHRARPRARVGVRAPTRILVVGGGSRLLPGLRGQHGASNARRSATLRADVHRRQAARGGRAHLAGRSPAAPPNDGRPAASSRAVPDGSAAMTPRVAAIACALALGASSAGGGVAAAVPRPHAPPADTLTTSFDVSGVHVILRRNPANDVVAVNLYLLGGTRGLTDSTVGIAPMMLWVSERGTQHYSREALRLKTAELGSSIVVEPQPDWTMFGFRGIRSTFDSTWVVFADRLMHPTLDSADVELTRSQVASGVRERRDSPDDWVEYLADSVAFPGTPYGLAASGTERSIASISAADLRHFRDTALVTSRMLVVVVGNVDSAQVARDVQRTLGTLPAGTYRWTAIPAGMAADTSGDPAVPGTPSPVVLEQRSLPTNYILGYYNGPAATSPDYQALRVAN